MREVRRVPENWQHPVDEKGQYIPLHGGSVSQQQHRWDEHNAKWNQGLRQDDLASSSWAPVEDEYKHLSFGEWDGPRPRPEEYMPDWSQVERTHYQMYEITTEGTPLSPVMASPQELARWLSENNASIFGGMTTDYNTWLQICLGRLDSTFLLAELEG